MLFLMNDAVLNLDSIKLSPKMAGRRFQALTLPAVRRLGQELYADDPLLHLRKPERAKRLATLIIAKSPAINAALFTAPAFACRPDDVAVRFASVDFEVMANLHRRQDEGLLDTVWTDRQVWRRLAA
ncbi:MAG: hypothetical protein ACK41C_00195 [Phenylobacterium sp.]|jgi:hypothetical protein|uniref:hypothetical protein n=1 Tax=Phenylobacterium sp. TaxID=1871053 RepID=UPI00391CAFC0